MTHPLDGARLKVERAQEHLQSLKAEIGTYLDSRPYEFPIEYKGEEMTARPAIIKDSPPHRLRSIVGDCLGNLRPILDYIAWELASRYSPKPVVRGKDRIYFPVSKDGLPPTKGLNDLADKYAIPPAATAMIESVQPYHPGYQPLSILNALVNEDKHCLPLLTVAYADTTSIDVTVEGPPLETCALHPPGSKAIVFGHNVSAMTVRRLTLEDLTDDGRIDPTRMPALPLPAAHSQFSPGQPRSVKVDGKVAIFVSIEHPSVGLEPVERTLEQICSCVASIILRFDSFVVNA